MLLSDVNKLSSVNAQNMKWVPILSEFAYFAIYNRTTKEMKALDEKIAEILEGIRALL